jgi:MFS-type transporter involved in bile tolerance (Atg22 family)
MAEIQSEKFRSISLWGWCLFDFANSIPAVIGGIYFSKWFTEDIGGSSILFNILFFLSAIFVILIGKWVGRKVDVGGFRYWIKLTSFISFLAIILLFLGSQFLPSLYLLPLSFVLFLIFLLGYQIGRICHNVYLRSIIPDHIQSKMSGFGAAANWAGSITGIVITIPVITAYPQMFAREMTFLVAAVSYGIFTSIALFLMLLSQSEVKVPISTQKNSQLSWKFIVSYMGVPLLIYLLLFDVMATVQRNLPPFLTSIYKMQDNTQAIGFLTILITAMIGGLIAARVVKRSNSNLWLKISSSILAFSIILITLNNNILLWAAFAMAGISYGILESAIRVNFMGTFSSENAGENFGILAVIERTSGVIGPLIWIVPFSLFSNQIHSYISSMLLMSSLTFLALILLFLKNPNRD